MSTSESKKTKKPCKILSQECIGTDIYSMWLDAGEIGKNAVPGQFVSVYTAMAVSFCQDPSVSVRSIKRRKTENGISRYRKRNRREFSRLHAGDIIEIWDLWEMVFRWMQ